MVTLSDFPIKSAVRVKVPWASPEFPEDSEVNVGLRDVTDCPDHDANKGHQGFPVQFNIAGATGEVVHSHAHMRIVQFHLEIDDKKRVVNGMFRADMLEPCDV